MDVQLNARVVDVIREGIEVEYADGRHEFINAWCKTWAAGVTLPGHPEIFVLGDMMTLAGLPGVAQVAIQGGRYAAKTIRARVEGRTSPAPFQYFDKGNMANISRFQALTQMGRLEFGGFIAWLVVHIAYLVGFKNRFTTFIHWIVSFIGRGRPERTATHQQVIGRLAMERLAEIQDSQYHLTAPSNGMSTRPP